MAEGEARFIVYFKPTCSSELIVYKLVSVDDDAPNIFLDAVYRLLHSNDKEHAMEVYKLVRTDDSLRTIWTLISDKMEYFPVSLDVSQVHVPNAPYEYKLNVSEGPNGKHWETVCCVSEDPCWTPRPRLVKAAGR